MACYYNNMKQIFKQPMNTETDIQLAKVQVVRGMELIQDIDNDLTSPLSLWQKIKLLQMKRNHIIFMRQTRKALAEIGHVSIGHNFFSTKEFRN